MSHQQPGIGLPPLSVIGQYHPHWALAAARGVSVRPDVRVLSVEFTSTAQVGQALPASYAEPLTKYSLFSGCEFTVDPTSSYTGNVLKGLNDTTMAKVSATTFTLLTTGPRGNYTPVFDDTPTQSIPGLLKPFAGMWMLGPVAENVKARFTLQSIPNGGVPFTLWLMMAWAVLDSQAACSDVFSLTHAEARKQLRDEGICCP